MSHVPASRPATRPCSRLASGVAAASLTVLALAVPAPALAGSTSVDGPVDVGAARNGIDAPTVDVRRLLNEVEADALAAARASTPAGTTAGTPAGTPATAPAPAADDGWFDATQLTLGALLGVVGAMVAGGAVRLALRHRRAPRPA